MFSKHVTDYLKAVHTPFDFHSNGRVPDGLSSNTVKLKDMLDLNPVYLPIVTGSTSITTICCAFVFGNNMITSGETTEVLVGYPSSTISGVMAVKPLYAPIFFALNSSNTPVSVTFTLAEEEENQLTPLPIPMDKLPAQLNGLSFGAEEKSLELDVTQATIFWTYGSVNYNIITGATNNNDWSSGGSPLITQMRFLNAGIRFLPLIEVATTNTVNYVMKYYGAQTTMGQLGNALANSSNIINFMQESAHYTESHNSQGIASRLDPAQKGILKNYEMQTLSNYSSTTVNNTDPGPIVDNIMIPLIAAQLVTAVNFTTTITSLPVIFRFSCELEGILTTPTPIVGDRPPFDSNFEKHLFTMSYHSKICPVVTTGHSFLSSAVDVLHKIVSNPIVQGAAESINPELGTALQVGSAVTGAFSNSSSSTVSNDTSYDVDDIYPNRYDNNTRRNIGTPVGGDLNSNIPRPTRQPMYNSNNNSTSNLNSGRNRNRKGRRRNKNKKNNMPSIIIENDYPFRRTY